MVVLVGYWWLDWMILEVSSNLSDSMIPSPNKHNTEISSEARSSFTNCFSVQQSWNRHKPRGVHLIDFGFDLHQLWGLWGVYCDGSGSTQHRPSEGTLLIFPTYLILLHLMGQHWSTQTGSLPDETKLEGVDMYLSPSIPTSKSPPAPRHA